MIYLIVKVTRCSRNEPDQRFYARYSNSKEKIIKAFGVELSGVTPEDNIGIILIGNDVIGAFLTNHDLSDLQKQLKKAILLSAFLRQ